ncbi:MAG: hypothetical protein JXJ04_18585 [Spirochaetales bacterium]|nr:hypothetical protein [Spirochaetales bacterium]
MKVMKIKQKDIEVSADDHIIVMKGEVNQEKPELFLTPFFKKVIAEMDRDIILDLTQLEFLNSSGIKPIIGFLIMRDPGYRVKIKTSPTTTWQRTSLKVLAELDDNIVLE